jgi:sugar phosphate isomerase/epimerase
MFHVAISQFTTPRWDLPEELFHLAENGFDRLSLWRPKLSDTGTAAAAALLAAAGVRASSLQWAGGFTGGDGRCYRDCLDDAVEAIDDAATLGAASVVIHSGCRGGHTRAHARRLLSDALRTLAPVARSAGVALALRPLHPAVADRCSFLHTLGDALDVVEQIDDPAVRLAVDLWQFGDAPELSQLLPRLAATTAVVQLADRDGPPTAEWERRPVGRGTLPLESLVLALVDHGFAGDFEFDPVGAEVSDMGYAAVLAETRVEADRLGRAVRERVHWHRAAAAFWQTAGLSSASAGGAAAQVFEWAGGQFRSTGSRRSHASSQTVSPG